MLLKLKPVGKVSEQAPYLVRHWARLTRRVASPGFELTIEEAAPILHTFKRLLDAGYEFDAMLIALMAVLERQCFNTSDDTDSDGGDDGDNDYSVP